MCTVDQSGSCNGLLGLHSSLFGSSLMAWPVNWNSTHQLTKFGRICTKNLSYLTEPSGSVHPLSALKLPWLSCINTLSTQMMLLERVVWMVGRAATFNVEWQGVLRCCCISKSVRRRSQKKCVEWYQQLVSLPSHQILLCQKYMMRACTLKRVRCVFNCCLFGTKRGNLCHVFSGTSKVKPSIWISSRNLCWHFLDSSLNLWTCLKWARVG